MADKSNIEWLRGPQDNPGATWNPLAGCLPVSPGCVFCYAAREASGRLANLPLYQGLAVAGRFTGEVRLAPERLDQPTRWRRPRFIFVNSMSDLFHKDVPDSYIATVFAVIALTQRHTYQLLTKRHGRMWSLLRSGFFQDDVQRRAEHHLTEQEGQGAALTYAMSWPLPNLWLGVSAETQDWAELRIRALLDTPAAVRWVSAEPLLAGIDLAGPGFLDRTPVLGECVDINGEPWHHGCPRCARLDWVVAGGESGRNDQIRPMHPGWATSIRDQCIEAGVPFLFKQWGEWAPASRERATHLLHMLDHSKGYGTNLIPIADGTVDHPYGHGSGLGQDLVDRGHPGWVRMWRPGKKAAGRELDGETWDQYPNQLQEASHG